jgi:hypothetical protein
VLTGCGALGDYLRFRPRWRRQFPALDEATVPWGLHVPMCDDPERTADAIDTWHRTRVGRAEASGHALDVPPCRTVAGAQVLWPV